MGCAPEGRRCKHQKVVSDGQDPRCTRWTAKLPGGRFDEYCRNHSKDPDTAAKAAADNAKARQASSDKAKQEKPKKVTLKDLFAGDLKQQDDVEKARLAVLSAVEDGKLNHQAAAVILSGLKDISSHIERYGAITGAEGGHSYMRLVPGMDIVEYEDPVDAVLSPEDVDKIDAGIIEDTKHGRQVPADFADCIFRYLGRKARRRDKSRYDKS